MQIQYRQLAWPQDREQVARLDMSFVTEHVFAVHMSASEVRLVEQSLPSPIRKVYELALDPREALSWSIVAECDGAIVGLVAVGLSAWNRRAIVRDLCVQPAMRRRGVGAGLIDQARGLAARQHARCLWVETQNVNVPAIRFYQRQGFTFCGLDTTLYDPASHGGEIALFLALPLQESGDVTA